MAVNIDNVLKNINTRLENPFKNGVILTGSETYGVGVRVHRVSGIKLIFENSICTIKFRKSDGVLACALTYVILLDPYGKDLGVGLFLNDSKQNIFSEYDKGVQSLIDVIENLENDINTIKVCFSDINVFNYHKQVLSYIITMDRDDDYWFNKEYKRWVDGVQTDDEV